MAEQEQARPAIPARALVVMAHPDDMEFSAAGTVARWTAAGSHVVLVLGTSGDKGSDDPEQTSEHLVEVREAEARAAASVLGIAEVEFLRFRDAELLPDLGLRLAITRMIRKHRPDALMCQDPTARWSGQGYIQHPDHIAMGEAALAAVFPSARDRLTFPQLLAEGYEPHKTPEVYLAGSPHIDIWVDVGASFETKLAALAEHKSQVGDWDFAPFIRRWAQDSAAAARFASFPGAEQMELAEGFKYFHLR